MTKKEYRATFSIGLIYAIRLIGLFMILPVFAPYAQNLIGSTPSLVGLAIGAYGLTQASLQIPMGLFSDRIGRKRVIILGLLVFAAGSIFAGMATSIHGVILGRLMQGGGAIGSTLSASIADLTRDEHRTKAMAMIGITIALSFFIAMLLGPILEAHIQVSGLFWLAGTMAIVGIFITLIAVPNAHHPCFHCDSETIPNQLKAMINQSELFSLDVGVFILHAILASCFIALPITILPLIKAADIAQWVLYLPVLILSFIVMIPWIIVSEKKRMLKQNLLLAVLAIGLSQLGLWELNDSLIGIAICLFVFFAAFSFLEATLPSLVSKIAPAGLKGTAMGAFSTSQYLGMFFGGAVGGLFLKHHDIPSLFLFGLLLAIIWIIVAANMKQPRYVSTQIVHIGPKTEVEINRLKHLLNDVPGVTEVAVMKGDEAAYLKVDKSIFKPEILDQIL